MLHHPPNFFAGWSLILLAFLTGAVIGLFFHQESFLGGYTSFRRRIVRLGHIALAALGMLNVLFALSPLPAAGSALAKPASALLIVGAITMPAVCFLTGWKQNFRHLFFIPVTALVAGVGLVLLGALQ
jgi:hypothetical protein